MKNIMKWFGRIWIGSLIYERVMNAIVSTTYAMIYEMNESEWPGFKGHLAVLSEMVLNTRYREVAKAERHPIKTIKRLCGVWAKWLQLM